MTKKHPASSAPPPLARVKGSPSTPGDYRIKVREQPETEVVLPVVQTVDSVDETYLYGRPSPFWGISAFKIERSTVEWHEKLP
jgi:hypothetical protein